MLGIVFLWIVVYLSGLLLCKIGREKGTSQLWIHLTGFFFLFFCQGVVFFCGQILQWNFQKACQVLVVCLTAFSLLATLFCRKELRMLFQKVKSFRVSQMPYGRYKALIAWLFLGLALAIAYSTVGNRNDAMVETVQTTLMTDTMNQHHPFTGQLMEQGMIMSKKIITLPFWYSALSLWTGFSAVDTVWVLGSIITMGLSLMAYGELAGLLFHRNFRKTWLVVFLMELLYLSGDYYVEAVGYRQLFYGYAGETIVASVMLPVVLAALYRLFGPVLRNDFAGETETLTVWGALVKLGLCLGASLFVAPFVWGVVVLVAAIVLFLLSIAGVCLTKIITGHKGE